MIRNPVEVVVEKVQRGNGDRPSCVEEVDSFLEEIRLTARRFLGHHHEARSFEEWLQEERGTFWSRQVEVLEEGGRFRIRLAVPGADADQLRVIVTAAGIDVFAGGWTRHIDLSAPADAASVAAMLDRGELQLRGSTIRRHARSAARAEREVV